MRILSFAALFLLSLTTGCVHHAPEPPPYVEGIPELEFDVITYGNDLERDHKLFLLDSRAYYDAEGFELVWMKFRTQALLDLCEGRDLIVDVVEGFLDRVNSDSFLPFLKHRPFDAAHLVIDIEFESFFGRYVDPLYLARIRLDKGLVFYYAHNAIDPEMSSWHQRIEPYEKAYRFSMFKHVNDARPDREERDKQLHRDLEGTTRGHRDVQHGFKGLCPEPLPRITPWQNQ